MHLNKKSTVSVESHEITLTRLSKNKFKIEFGDIELLSPDVISCHVGDSISMQVGSVLVNRTNGRALLCSVDGICYDS